MELGIQGRRALVTGASRGLGAAIAVALAAEGAEVLAVARQLERLEELAAAHAAAPGTAGGSITPRVCDLADPAAIEALGASLLATDILVINTGGPPPGLAADIPDTIWSRQFESMFLSAIRLTRLTLPGMRQRRFGRIIVVISSGVIQPIPNLAVSNALRAAVVGWAKTLAGEVAGDGVTVNCVAPGRIATQRVAELDAARASREGISRDEVERQSRESIPVGRYGEPAEFAAVATFLAGNRSSYVTGDIIRVDGGMIRSV